MTSETQETLEIQCETCGARVNLAPELRTVRCPYCDSPAVVERPATRDRPQPTFVVGFILESDAAEKLVRRWLKTRGMLAHSGLKKAVVANTKGIYLPAYLYCADSESEYRAQIGEEYQETETYTTTDSKGNVVVRTRTVTKTEWRALSGSHSCYLLDVVVTASRGISNDQLALVEPFDLRALQRYQPALISGWIAEEPSLSRDQCMQMAREESVQKVAKMLPAFMPGDSHRDLQFDTRLEHETIDMVYLPVWVFSVRYDQDADPVLVLINGQTGELVGRAPKSKAKIAILVAVILVVILLVVVLANL